MAQILRFALPAAFNGRRGLVTFGVGTPAVPVPGILYTALPSAITEGGDDQTLSFRLMTQPTSGVVVTVASGDPSALATTGGSFVSFTTSNWDTAQSITLTAPADSDIVDETVTVTLTGTSSDSDYSGELSTFTVTVTDAGVTPTMWLVGSTTDYLSSLNFLPAGVSATRVGNSPQFGVSENNINGLAWHDGVLYAVGNDDEELFSLNTTTGAATVIGSVFSGASAPIGLTSHGGVLYMVSNSPTDALYSVNTSTGVATLIGPDNFGSANEGEPRALASDGTTMYMMGWVNDQIYSLNPSTGVAVAIGGPQRPALTGADAMTFHEGTLYAARNNGKPNNANDFSTSRLVSINTSTGAPTEITTSSNLNINATTPKGLASNQPLASGASGSFMGFVPTNMPGTITEGFDGHVQRGVERLSVRRQYRQRCHREQPPERGHRHGRSVDHVRCVQLEHRAGT